MEAATAPAHWLGLATGDNAPTHRDDNSAERHLLFMDAGQQGCYPAAVEAARQDITLKQILDIFDKAIPPVRRRTRGSNKLFRVPRAFRQCRIALLDGEPSAGRRHLVQILLEEFSLHLFEQGCTYDMEAEAKQAFQHGLVQSTNANIARIMHEDMPRHALRRILDKLQRLPCTSTQQFWDDMG